jgi:hypothetical protein
MPSFRNRRIKIDLVEWLTGPMQEVLATQGLTLHDSTWMSMAYGFVEFYRFSPSRWIMVTNPSPSRITVERTAQTRRLDRVPESSLSQVLGTLGTVPTYLDQWEHIPYVLHG